MKNSLHGFLLVTVFGLLIAAGLNAVQVRGPGSDFPDGYTQYHGFPLRSCSKFVDFTNPNNRLHCDYAPMLGNTLLALFVVYGIWGNAYFFRAAWGESAKKERGDAA